MTADEIQPDAYPPTAAGPSPETAEVMRDLDYRSPHASDPLPHYFGDLLH